MEVVIIANGEIKQLDFLQGYLQRECYVICADGAAKYLVPLHIVPDLLVGDLDSISKEDLEWMTGQGVQIKKFPPRKDFTDSELALEYALELKPDQVTIVGGVGSRWDHSLSNIMFLDRLFQMGVKGKLINENSQLTITDRQLELSGEPGDIVSIIPLSETVEGVTLRGLEYPLTDHYIPRGSSLGISNRMLEYRATISLKRGTLLVYIGKEH